MASLERPRVEYRTPEDLTREVKAGLIRIPPFQRTFRWDASDIVRLFDSIWRGFPIGNLLLWQRPAPAQRLQVGPLSVDAGETEAALWVVDGQQRIVSLVGALTSAHQAVDARFRVHLDLDEGQFHTAGLRQQPPRSWIPVSFLLDTATLLRWMRENAGWLGEEQITRADQAAKAIREYQIPTYVVRAASEDALLEIFTRMNTMGKRLTRSEVFQALHAGTMSSELTTLQGLGRVSAELGFGTLPDRLVLRSILAFRGGDIFREEFAHEFAEGDDPAEIIREVAAALRDVIAYLRSVAGIPHVRLLPYSHVVPTLVRFVRLHGPPEGRASTLLRRWIWRGAVAGTRARGISVADIRAQIVAAESANPVDAASELLRQVPAFPDFTAELDKIHFNHAMTKLNVLGLLSAEPRDPANGDPVEIVQLLDDGSPLRSITTRKDLDLAATIADRTIIRSVPGGNLAQLLAAAPAAIAASHLIDEEGQQLLADGRHELFLHQRAITCVRTITDHVNQMAEWGARDGRSMVDVLRSAA